VTLRERLYIEAIVSRHNSGTVGAVYGRPYSVDFWKNARSY
jgi:hypothetical protein